MQSNKDGNIFPIYYYYYYYHYHYYHYHYYCFMPRRVLLHQEHTVTQTHMQLLTVKY